MHSNPWLGLLSYEDPAKTKADYAFCGRDVAINSLFAMVDNNILVSLYGKTGVGKTSVLNAGVCPLLRSRNYFPVYVRLGKYDNVGQYSFSEFIVKAILEEIHAIGGSCKTQHPDVAESGTLANDYLWRFFCTHSFFNSQEEELYPVITLDQFEEIFISHPKESATLLKQIYALMDDNREVPTIDGYSDSTNFRFVFSIREDDLFYLEDCIDMNHLAEMKQNRYRLAPLSEMEAREIILLGRNYMEKNAEEEIISRILRLSKGENGQISTNILSLVCSQLFIQQEGNLTLEGVADSNKNPLDIFYLDCISRVTEKARTFIESELVEQDRRRLVPKENFEASLSPHDIEFLTTGQYRIIQNVSAGSRECIELIHDSLAKTIYHLKTEAEERLINQKLEKRNRRIKKRTIWLSVLSTVLAASLVYLYFHPRNNRAAINTPQRITLLFKEDSAIVAEREFWIANLYVQANNEHSRDTLIDRVVDNKFSVRDSSLWFLLDSAKTVRITLTFNPGLRYRNIDTVMTATDMSNHPILLLPVHKLLPRLYTYSSVVYTSLNKRTVRLSEAVVVLKDKVAKTDYNGRFTFKIENELSSDDYLYIVKQGYDSYARKIYTRGRFPASIALHLSSDSLFFEKCKEVESPVKDWDYKDSRRVDFFDGRKDSLILCARYLSRTTDNTKFNVSGYYYFLKEYKRLGRLAYRFCSGWIDNYEQKQGTREPRNYSIEGFDYANNRQRLSGQFVGTRFSGTIQDARGNIAYFGNLPEDQRLSLIEPQ